jgi:guanylate kinase
VLQWLMFQMGSVGPMLGQAHHFRIYAPEKLPYAIDRYTNEARRIYNVMNKRLANSRGELGAAKNYDYLVVNDDLDQAVAHISSIIIAESLRLSRRRQVDLDHLVR